MKLASFNINNINKRLNNLLHWLARAAPDVVCLQELKAEDGAFPRAALTRVGYQAAWCGQRSWNGVAILARGAEPIVTRRELPGDTSDRQCRYIEAAVRGVLVACIYAPNGNPQPGSKFAYKLDWLDRLNRHAGKLIAQGVPVVMAGDFNVVPTERDIYRTTSWKDDAVIQPEPRQQFQALLSKGWVDSLRSIHPESPDLFSFWDYKRQRWERNAGMRLDHILLSPAIAGRLADAGIDKEVRGESDASDHAPVWVELSERKTRLRRRS